MVVAVCWSRYELTPRAASHAISGGTTVETISLMGLQIIPVVRIIVGGKFYSTGLGRAGKTPDCLRFPQCGSVLRREFQARAPTRCASHFRSLSDGVRRPSRFPLYRPRA